MGLARPHVHKHYAVVITRLKALEYLRGVVIRFAHSVPNGAIVGKQCVKWEDDTPWDRFSPEDLQVIR